jgi:uncharacterized protein
MYPCTKCGACCRNIKFIPQLDRGDGVCKHYDSDTKLCSIYDTRPLICRIDKAYDKIFNKFMTKKTFYNIQIKSCNKLDDSNNIPLIP